MFSLVAQSCLTLCDSMDCNKPGFPCQYHQLPEPIQTPVHRVGHAIQPSHPLSSPFLSRSKCLLISWLQSPSAVFFEPPKKVCHCFHCFLIYWSWSDGIGCHDLVFWMFSFKPTSYKWYNMYQSYVWYKC